MEAVKILMGQTMADWKPPPAPKKDEPKVLLLPLKNKMPVDCVVDSHQKDTKTKSKFSAESEE